jgi:hypothetical protein
MVAITPNAVPTSANATEWASCSMRRVCKKRTPCQAAIKKAISIEIAIGTWKYMMLEVFSPIAGGMKNPNVIAAVTQIPNTTLKIIVYSMNQTAPLGKAAG